jgi:response regulator RpfG family c-di-GMP phosphodiesterase
MAFATSAVEALEILDRETFDVIISDMRMPGMDGGDLLAEVQKRHPHMLRIILSGYSDQAMIMKTVKPAHQFLSKPCNHSELQEVVERSMQLRGVLGNEHVRSILSDVEALPSLPEVYQALETELGRENPSLEYIGDIIEQDLGLTASLLKLVNSSFFGLRRHVSSPHQAVVLLGTETVKSLMLIIELVKRFHVKESLHVDATLLWEHSTFTGHLARCIAAKCQKSKDVVDNAFIAGLLHAIPICIFCMPSSRFLEPPMRKWGRICLPCGGCLLRWWRLCFCTMLPAFPQNRVLRLLPQCMWQMCSTGRCASCTKGTRCRSLTWTISKPQAWIRELRN